jgi:hypothetical protein
LRVTEAAGAGAQCAPGARVQDAPVGSWRDIVDDVVGMHRIAGYPGHGREVVELQEIANTPSDEVVGTRSIAAHTETADPYAALGIKREAAAKHVDAANAVADHWVGPRGEREGISLVSYCWIYGVAMLQAVETTQRCKFIFLPIWRRLLTNLREIEFLVPQLTNF